MYEKDPFASGQAFGTGFLAVYSKNPSVKLKDIADSYDYLAGFVVTDPNNERYDINDQDMYNNMDNLGSDFINLIRKAFTY